MSITTASLKQKVAAVPLLGTYLVQNRTATSLYRTAIYARYFLKQGMWRSFVRSPQRSTAALLSQSIRIYPLCRDDLTSSDQLRDFLAKSRVEFVAGDHAFYLPPQASSTELLGSSLGIYPPHVGLKILTDFQPPERSNYLGADSLRIRRLLLGSSADFLYKANYLYALGIGPRIWDACCLQAGDNYLTAFVVEHIDGITPTAQQHADFMRRLNAVVKGSSLRISVPGWESSKDFSCPECHGNLVYCPRTAKTYYVDFQNFVLTHRFAWTKSIETNGKPVFHFGRGRLLRGSSYPYQSNPILSSHGKRDTETRWKRILGLLKEAQIDVSNRLVLDIGCNAGFMMRSALCNGAAWAIGWDRPEVVDHARNLQLSLGMSRFGMIGANLDSGYALADDIPAYLEGILADSVVLYLSVHRHIGFLHSLAEMPWRVLVFEGHQGEDPEGLKQEVSKWLGSSARIVSQGTWPDGDSLSRTVSVIVRDR